jgi:WD40 repeat protein
MRGTLLGVILWASACATRPLTPPAAAPQRPADGCPGALEARHAIDGLLAAGRLERALDAVSGLAARCPAEKASTDAVEVAALAEIGRYAAARALAADIERAGDQVAKEAAGRALAVVERNDRTFEATDAAKTEMRRLWREAQRADDEGRHLEAKTLYERAWDSWHPLGGALYGAGRNALLAGDVAGAQRLFDRALVDLERSGDRARVEGPNGFTNVNAVRWSPDRRALVVADGREIKVLSPESGRQLARMLHSAEVTSVVVSGDGTGVLCSSRSGEIKIWDLMTGQLRRELAGASGVISSLDWSGDGDLVAAAEFESGRLLVWRGTDTKPTRVLEASPGTTSVAFSARRLVSGSRDGQATLWDIDTGKPLRKLPGQQATISSIAANGRTLATGAWDASVRLWNLEAPAGGWHPLEGHAEKVTAVALSRDGALLASGSRDGTVRVWEVARGKLIGVIDDVGSEVVAVSVSPQWDIAAATSDTVHLWNVTGRGALSLNAVKMLQRHALDNTAAALSPNGRWLAVGASDGAVRVWDLDAGTLAHSSFGHWQRVAALAVSDDASVVSASPDRTVRLWSSTGEPRGMLDLSGATSVALDADGATIGLSNGRIVLWRPGDASAPRILGGHLAAVTALSKVAGVTASSAMDGTVRVSRGGDSALTIRVGEIVGSLALAEDGRTLATAGGKVRLWSSADGKLLRTIDEESSWVALRQNRVVSVSPAGKLSVWPLDGGERQLELDRAGRFALLSPSLLITDGGTEIQLARPAGEPLAVLRSVHGSNSGYVLTPDGHVETTGSARDAARDKLYCFVGARSYPLELCEDRLLGSHLLASRLAQGSP